MEIGELYELELYKPISDIAPTRVLFHKMDENEFRENYHVERKEKIHNHEIWEALSRHEEIDVVHLGILMGYMLKGELGKRYALRRDRDGQFTLFNFRYTGPYSGSDGDLV